MFHGRADEPDGAGGTFNVEAAARVDCDLRQGGVVDVVVRGPEPDVLEVERGGGGGDVHAHVGGKAICVDSAGRGRGWALRFLQGGAGEAADACVDVPHAGGGGGGGG